MVTVRALSLLSIHQWLASMTDELWANEIACFYNAVFHSLCHKTHGVDHSCRTTVNNESVSNVGGEVLVILTFDLNVYILGVKKNRIRSKPQSPTRYLDRFCLFGILTDGRVAIKLKGNEPHLIMDYKVLSWILVGRSEENY
jgi:hypothetical protein